MSDGKVHGRLFAGVREFLRLEAAGGIVLLGAALLALLASNTPVLPLYDRLFDLPIEIRIGQFAIAKPLLLWINDGLMAIFFLLVGLEIKRELLEGELSSLRQALLPVVAAIGGMAAPAGIYYALNAGDADALRGWAIPTATDIAFAIGVLTLLGPRIPVGLKVFLLAVAIFDDLGAIVVIALFYTAELSTASLLSAAAVLAIMLALNRAGITRAAPYILLGILLWICVLKSGVHATLAGVAIAFAVPLRGRGDTSPAKQLEHVLHPWVAFLVVPLFGFANAGVPLAASGPDLLTGNISLGIAAGLLIGKPIGVFATTALCIALGIARRPDGATWLGLVAVSVLAGIGFTMSLFIGTLAWESGAHAAQLRIGVLAASLLAGAAGYLLLRAAYPRRDGKAANAAASP